MSPDDSSSGVDTWIDPEEQGVPWVNPEIQQRVQWRNGDIVISVPIKSGTTWTMNIVHQLRSGGDPDVEDVYDEVPWLELLKGPGDSVERAVDAIDSMPDGRRRAFKTHAAPGMLPYHAPGVGAEVQYVVIMRNPDEVLASIYPFIRSHAAGWLSHWGIDKDEFVPPDINACFEEFAKPMLGGGLFGFLAAWWQYRDQPNVLLMHFSDMKRDHEGSVRRLAKFLGFSPTEKQWRAVLEYTSFAWMKQHEHKFELPLVADVPVLDPGAMVRKGKTGAAHEDGVTPEMSAELAAIGREFLNDADALQWLYHGRR